MSDTWPPDPPPAVTGKPPPLTTAQRDWIRLRDSIGLDLDLFLDGEPSHEMRQVIEDLESCLAEGDRAAGLL